MIGCSDFLRIESLYFDKELLNMNRLVKTAAEIKGIVPVKMRLLPFVLQDEVAILL